MTPEEYNKKPRAMMFGGIAMLGVGLAGYYTSFYLGVKKFDQSVIRYNRMVDKDKESSSLDRYQFQIGLQANPSSDFPLLSLRLKL